MCVIISSNFAIVPLIIFAVYTLIEALLSMCCSVVIVELRIRLLYSVLVPSTISDGDIADNHLATSTSNLMELRHPARFLRFTSRYDEMNLGLKRAAAGPIHAHSE